MIKKLTQAMLALALVGGMSACTKSMNGVDEGTTSATGDTYMSVTFSTANPNSTRADEVKEDPNFNSIGEFIGRDKIENVKVYVIDGKTEAVTKRTFTTVTDVSDNNTDTKAYRTEAWKTTPGEKIVYVYVNIVGTPMEGTLDAATSKTAFEEAAKAPYALTKDGAVLETIAKVEENGQDKKDIIAMAPIKPEPLNVTAGVTKDEAEAKTKPFAQAKNCVQVSVRRLVAQAAVTAKAGEFSITENRGGAEKALAKLTDLQWDVMQFEKTTYLAAQPTEAGKDAMLAMYCKSPSFGFVTDDNTYAFTKAADHYEYREFTGAKVETFTRSTNTNSVEKNKEDVTNIVKNTMKFITETTHQYGGKLAKDGGTGTETGYRKGNTTYVIVSAKISPADAAWAEGEKDTYQDNGDLYFGVQDHKFYASLEKARKANKSSALPGEPDAKDAPDNVIKYTGGICYYVAWLNPNTATAGEPIVSPILRNNIYHVNITGMKRLGYSGNPFNPGGDNPKDPDDPTPDPKETLYPIDTYMAVEINVVNWGVHSYDHEF